MNIFNKNTSNIILIVLFISILLFLSIINIPSIYKAYKNAAKAENIMAVNKEFEKEYKGNFYGKSKFIDLYGLSLIMLNKKTVLNLHRINIDGIITMNSLFNEQMRRYSDDDIINNLNDMITIAKNNNIKFIYIQQPYQVNIIAEHYKRLFGIKFQKTIDYVRKFLEDNVTYIDAYSELINNGFKNENIFFKTDLHNQTYTEFSIIPLLINALEKNGIFYNDDEKKQVLNIDNYNVIKKEFRGNTVASAGRFFGESDIFEMYIPKFNTNLKTIIDNSTIKSGAFNDSMMHDSTYYVLNYGFFTVPVYQIENLITTNNYNILFISDSISTRFITYFSLLTKNITVFDPRFNPDNNVLINLIKNNKYDCIVMTIGEPSILYNSNLGIGK